MRWCRNANASGSQEKTNKIPTLVTPVGPESSILAGNATYAWQVYIVGRRHRCEENVPLFTQNGTEDRNIDIVSLFSSVKTSVYEGGTAKNKGKERREKQKDESSSHHNKRQKVRKWIRG